jgi:hypothetical protein
MAVIKVEARSSHEEAMSGDPDIVHEMASTYKMPLGAVIMVLKSDHTIDMLLPRIAGATNPEEYNDVECALLFAAAQLRAEGAVAFFAQKYRSMFLGLSPPTEH